MQKPVLKIPARYYRLYLEEKPYGCLEKDFHYVEELLEIPVVESALILVDCWSIHYCGSYLSRSRKIVEEKIVPVVDAARRTGVTVIHAPSSNVAEKYPQSSWCFEKGDEERFPTYASVDPEWPPREFVERMGCFSVFNRGFSPPRETWEHVYREKLMIAEPLTPQPDDYVVRSGRQLHRILKKLRKLHLFYAGFATNMCLQHRDYGVRAMSEMGYNIVLLRDCTAAIEAHDTVNRLLATRIFVQEIETKYAWSTTSKDFIKACINSSKNPNFNACNIFHR
ncbi:MAG: isochorismatase family protein [Thermoproteota archaeon]